MASNVPASATVVVENSLGARLFNNNIENGFTGLFDL